MSKTIRNILRFLPLLLLFSLPVSLPAHAAPGRRGTNTSAATAEAARPLTPALWVIRKGRATATLFGTIHMLPRNVDWFKAPIARALDSSDTLILEAIPPETPTAILPLQNKYARLPSPRPVMTRVPAEWRPTLAKAIKNFNPNILEWYKDWYIALLISIDEMHEDGFEAGLGTEAVLTARARMRHIPVSGLETAEQQLVYFATLSEDEQRELLLSTIKKAASEPGAPKRLVAQWLAGKTDALAKDLNAEFSDSPRLRQLLLADRNQRWAAEIARRLKRPGHIFVAVGAGHFAGDGNLLEALAQYGLKAEPVLQSPTPAASK